MHGYAFSICSYRGLRINPQRATVSKQKQWTRCLLPGPGTSSRWTLSWRDTGEKAKQNSARNNTKCSKCFQLLNIVVLSMPLTRSPGRRWKPKPQAEVFKTSLDTWRILSQCMKNMYDPFIKVVLKSEVDLKKKKKKIFSSSRKHTYLILTPLNPTFI